MGAIVAAIAWAAGACVLVALAVGTGYLFNLLSGRHGRHR